MARYFLPIIWVLMFPSLVWSQGADLVVTIGGDVGFTASRDLPNPDGIQKWGRKMKFAAQTQGILPLLRGADINFCNIETVITDRMDLEPAGKQYNFQGHPRAVEQLVNMGFNMFSVANNHTYDYGVPGMEETLYHMNELQKKYNIVHSGLGSNLQEALTPKVLEVKGIRIGFLAFSNAPYTYFPQSNLTGVIGYGSDNHLKQALKKLKQLNVDLRFVSIHTGTERQVVLDKYQRQRFNWILKEGNVDVIIGHHPHVVRPVEVINGKPIFYSLGNYFMIGAADLTKFGTAADYGLFAKLYFIKNPQTGKLEVKAVQAIPLTGMNWIPRQMKPNQARERIQILNDLGIQELQDKSMQFEIEEKTGTGIWKIR